MEKNFWCAVLIALYGGFIGLQNFYLGKYVRGVLSVLFAWTCIPSFVAYIEAIFWLFKGKTEWDKIYNKNNVKLLLD